MEDCSKPDWVDPDSGIDLSYRHSFGQDGICVSCGSKAPITTSPPSDWQGHTGLLKTSNPGAKGWGARAK